jgi:hypothetical protein
MDSEDTGTLWDSENDLKSETDRSIRGGEDAEGAGRDCGRRAV